MQITTQIYQVGGSEHSHMSDASVYLINHGNESALIDAGTGEGHEEIFDNIRNLGITTESIKYLFLTHCHYDHTGGAAVIRQETDCKIVAHELDSVYLENGDSNVTAASWYGVDIDPVKIDIKVSIREEEFNIGGLNLKYIHTPGHSPGSSIITIMSDGKLVLFGQDVHGPLNRTILSSRDDYINSLNFMISLNADVLCEGHFGVFHGREKVKSFIESYL